MGGDLHRLALGMQQEPEGASTGELPSGRYPRKHQSGTLRLRVVRGALASDQSDVRTEALELASAARSGMESAPEGLRLPLEELSGASQRLAELDGTDLRRARSAFGDVSRELIALLTAEPGLQEGLWVYDCPMAEGYSKWVQADEKVSNPYMGSEMLQCGKVAEF